MPRTLIASGTAAVPGLPRRLRTVVWITAEAAMLLSIAGVAGHRMVWNLTSSLPRGLYMVDRAASPTRGAVVSFQPPESAARTIAARRYLPPGADLLKRILAMPGDRVCTDDRSLVVNGRFVGAIAEADTAGRRLDAFHYCGIVTDGWAFVGTSAVLSFDSRYFGPVPLSSLTVVEALWTF